MLRTRSLGSRTHDKLLGLRPTASKSSYLSLKCSQIEPSISFSCRNAPSNPKNISTICYRRSFIQSCTQSWSSTMPSDPTRNKLSDFVDACWRFMRPHTMYGTILGSSALFARALMENPNLIEWSLVFKALSGLFALICGNGYIVGINQIYDIEIDKVNKPDLPLASGDLSVESAWLLVVFFFVAGLSIVASTCDPLVTFVACTGLFLGTVYSIPPFRLRRFPVAAFFIIAMTRGFLLNFGVYHATRATLGLPFQWSTPLVFITTFITVFALVIAITKDLPDVEGDTKFQVSTLATKLGARNIAYVSFGLLLFNYVASILAAIYMPQAFKRSFLIPAHSILAMSLLYKIRVLKQANFTKEASTRFYGFIWKLFYAAYIIFPFI